MQSGSALCPWAISRVHGKTAQRVAAAVDCPSQDGSQALLQCLQQVDAHELEAVSQDIYASLCLFIPYISQLIDVKMTTCQ